MCVCVCRKMAAGTKEAEEEKSERNLITLKIQTKNSYHSLKSFMVNLAKFYNKDLIYKT